MGTKLMSIVRYPFTGGAVTLAVATLVGMIPYAVAAGVIVAGAFAIPIARSSGRNGPEADSMPRLLPPPPGLFPELAMGAVVHLVYFIPFYSVMAFRLLAEDVPALEGLYSLMILPLFAHLVILVFLPGAIAVLAVEGSPLPAFSRARVMKTAEQMGGGYGGVVAMVLFGGLAVLLLGDWLSSLGWVGIALDSLLVAWYWIVCLHLIGRALRKRKLFDQD